MTKEQIQEQVKATIAHTSIVLKQSEEWRGRYIKYLQGELDECPEFEPTPPEEPSGVEEAAARKYPVPSTGFDYNKGKQIAFIEGAKWQSTHNTLEWPSEQNIEDAITEHFNEKYPNYDVKANAFKSGAIWAIQWLKSILK